MVSRLSRGGYRRIARQVIREWSAKFSQRCAAPRIGEVESRKDTFRSHRSQLNQPNRLLYYDDIPILLPPTPEGAAPQPDEQWRLLGNAAVIAIR